MKKVVALAAVAASIFGAWGWLQPEPASQSTENPDIIRRGIGPSTVDDQMSALALPKLQKRDAKRTASSKPQRHPSNTLREHQRVESAGIQRSTITQSIFYELDVESMMQRFETLSLESGPRERKDIGRLLVDSMKCRHVSSEPKGVYRIDDGTYQVWERRRDDCDAFTYEHFEIALSWMRELAESGDAIAKKIYVDYGTWPLQSTTSQAELRSRHQAYLRIARRYVDEEILAPRAESLGFLADALLWKQIMPPDYQLGYAFRFASQLNELGHIEDGVVNSARQHLSEDELRLVKEAAQAILAECC